MAAMGAAAQESVADPNRNIRVVMTNAVKQISAGRRPRSLPNC
jgi:hypothetical protein